MGFVVLLQVVPLLPPRPPVDLPPPAVVCVDAVITGYVRSHGSSRTYDGTSVWTQEPITAASWNVPLDTMVTIDGLGTFRVADRGKLAPTHFDVLVDTVSEAYALTSVRRACWRDP